MKDEDALPISTPTAHSALTTTIIQKKESSDPTAARGRGYKFWALSAILLLALWSMFTGTVTLRWSAGNLNHISDDFEVSLHHDFDVLETEEREKLVRHYWDVYTNNRRIRLPRFWREAFEAAYEDLTGEDLGVRDAAISEIAKMSFRTIDFEPASSQSSIIKGFRLKQKANDNKDVTYRGGRL